MTPSFYAAPPLQLNTYNRHQGVHISVFSTNVFVVEIFSDLLTTKKASTLWVGDLWYLKTTIFYLFTIYFKRIEKSCTTDHLN